jgi:hypothetical protein
MSRKESIYIILLLILYSISDLIITLSQIGATSFIEGNPLMSWVITNYGKCGLCWIKIMFTTLACIILYFALPRVKKKILFMHSTLRNNFSFYMNRT